MIPDLIGLPAWLFPDGFKHPGRLFLTLLAPLGLLVYLLLLRLKPRGGVRFTNTALLSRVMRPQRRWLRHLGVVLSLLSLAAVSIAFAIPYAKDMVPRERATVVLVLDVSQSMAATDVKPNRLDAAKAAAKEFVKSLPDGYNVALVSLSGNPALRLPPVQDHDAAARAIDVLTLADGTAVGEALYTSIDGIAQAPRADDGSVAPAAIVLLSDGMNTAGRAPRQAALDVKAKGVKVYTVAYGTQMGYVDLDGKRESVPPDEELMAEIAQTTGGDKVDAKNAEGLTKAYETLRSKVGYDEVRTEVTARFAGLALVFGMLAALAAVLMGAKY